MDAPALEKYRTLIVAIAGIVALVVLGLLSLDPTTTGALVAGVVAVVTAQAGKSGAEAVAKAKASGVDPAKIAAEIVSTVARARAAAEKKKADEEPTDPRSKR
jgi:hypothetical protein